jgi:hypothetical protein
MLWKDKKYPNSIEIHISGIQWIDFTDSLEEIKNDYVEKLCKQISSTK